MKISRDTMPLGLTPIMLIRYNIPGIYSLIKLGVLVSWEKFPYANAVVP